MKQIKTIFIALALTLGAVSFAQAQSKVAHIESQSLIESMPGYTNAMSQLDKLQTTYKSDISDMLKEAQNKNKQYQAEAPNKTDQENAARAQELQGTQDKIMQYQQNAQKQLQKKENDLLKPVYEKARKAIQKVARAKGYDYVLDSTTGAGGVLMADGYDLLPDVKSELGI